MVLFYTTRASLLRTRKKQKGWDGGKFVPRLTMGVGFLRSCIWESSIIILEMPEYPETLTRRVNFHFAALQCRRTGTSRASIRIHDPLIRISTPLVGFK